VQIRTKIDSKLWVFLGIVNIRVQKSMSKVYKKCGNCRGSGHNIRSCSVYQNNRQNLCRCDMFCLPHTPSMCASKSPLKMEYISLPSPVHDDDETIIDSSTDDDETEVDSDSDTEDDKQVLIRRLTHRFPSPVAPPSSFERSDEPVKRQYKCSICKQSGHGKGTCAAGKLLSIKWPEYYDSVEQWRRGCELERFKRVVEKRREMNRV